MKNDRTAAVFCTDIVKKKTPADRRGVCFLSVAVVIVKDRKERNVERKNDRQDRIFEDMYEIYGCVYAVDDKVGDQYDDDDQIDENDQACRKVRPRLRLTAVFSVAAQV